MNPSENSSGVEQCQKAEADLLDVVRKLGILCPRDRHRPPPPHGALRLENISYSPWSGVSADIHSREDYVFVTRGEIKYRRIGSDVVDRIDDAGVHMTNPKASVWYAQMRMYREKIGAVGATDMDVAGNALAFAIAKDLFRFRRWQAPEPPGPKPEDPAHFILPHVQYIEILKSMTKVLRDMIETKRQILRVAMELASTPP